MNHTKTIALSRTAIISLCLAVPHWVASPALAQPTGLPSMGTTSAADLSPAMEKRLGDLIITQGRLDPTFVHDPEINQYLNQLGDRLVRHAPGGSAQIDLFAVRDPAFNAFALPGGYIGINTGVIVQSETEAQLAGVVAHEIAHVTQRHVARGITQQKQTSALMLASIAGALLAAVTGGASLAAGIAAFGQAAAIDRQLGFSRQAEQEADRIGLQMLSKGGYDPVGMQEMFGKLLQSSQINMGTAGGNTYLSTHPLSIDRMGDMQNRTRSLPGRIYRDSDAYWYVRARALIAQSGDRSTMTRVRDRMRDETTRTSGTRRSAAYLALAELATRQGNFAQALTDLQRAREGVPESPYLVRQQAWIELLRGQPEATVSLARNGLQRWPDHLALYEVQAHALQRLGQDQQVVELLNRAIRKWPTQLPSLYQMQANSLIKTGQPAQARIVQSEYYVLTGAFPAALAQLEQARQMTQNFQEQSRLDVRIREIKHMVAQEREVLERFGS